MLFLDLLAACTPKGDGTDSGGDDTGAPSSPCSPYSSAAPAGALWEWQVTAETTSESGTSGAWEVEAQGEVLWNDVPAWRVTLEGSLAYADPDDDNTSQAEAWYTCDEDGVRILGSESTRTYTDGTVSVLRATYDPPALTVPFALEVGSTWDQVSTITIDRDGEADSQELDSHAEVVGIESVTVPAGTWDQALHITSTGPSGVGDWYVVAGVGAVAYETSELTGWSGSARR